jgi:hypothetical protein
MHSHVYYNIIIIVSLAICRLPIQQYDTCRNKDNVIIIIKIMVTTKIIWLMMIVRDK